MSKINGSHGVFVGSRIYQGGCPILATSGVFFFVYPATSSYVVSGDLGELLIS